MADVEFIELVVKIPKVQKKMVDNIMELPSQVKNDLISAIRHGTPLTSSVLADAISRQAVIEYIEGSEAELGHSSENELVCQYFKELPPVTPQPKMGHWIFVHPLQEDDEGAYCCSVCGNGDWGIDPERDKYCYNCGAKMQEVKG